MPTTVWAPDPLPELDGRVGFVQIDDDAQAAALLEADQVQHPGVGAMHMRAPYSGSAGAEHDPDAQTYATRDLSAARAPRQARAKKASE